MLVFATLLATLSSTVRSRAAVELENLALRHQIGVLRRSAKRPKSTPVDPLFCEPVLFEFIGAGGAAKGL